MQTHRIEAINFNARTRGLNNTGKRASSELKETQQRRLNLNNKQVQTKQTDTDLEEIKDVLKVVVLSVPLVIIGMTIERIQELNKSAKTMLNKAKKFATKKG